MAWSVRANGGVVTGTGTLSATAMTMPTHATGDLVLMTVGQRGTTAVCSVTGGNWTEHPNSPWQGASGMIVHLYWVIAQSSSETAPTVTITGAGANDTRIIVLSSITGGNASTTAPFGPSSSVSDNASAQNITFGTAVDVYPGYGVVGTAFTKNGSYTSRSGISGTSMTINTGMANNTTTTGDDAGQLNSLGSNTTASTINTGTAGLYTITGGTAQTSIAFWITLKPLGATDGTSTAAGDVAAVGTTVGGDPLRAPTALVQHLLNR